MTNPVILYGTQSNGETLPVQVDATGRLVAEGLQGEQGIQGPPGPEGPPGPKGDDGDLTLPPNPQEGQVLGWENGELVWMTIGTAFDLQYLVIGGGGNSAIPTGFSYQSGGGAGGYISGVNGEKTGGNTPSPGPLSIDLPPGGLSFDVYAGGPAGDSLFSGTDFSFQALAGGSVNVNGGVGASGAGGGQMANGEAGGPGSPGTEGQGFKGGDGRSWNPSPCQTSNFFCHYNCYPYQGGRGGGGAGGEGSGNYAGAGIASSITGTSVTYAVGGRGNSRCASQPPVPTGQDNYGGGGYNGGAGQPGAVILRYPSYISMIARDGGTASLDYDDQGGYMVLTITGGYCVLMCSFQPGFFMSKLRQKIQEKQ